MNLFVNEIVTPPAHLPVTVDSAQDALARAVTEELERSYLWRAIVRQERKIVIDGPLPTRIEIEPIVSITSFTRWTPTDDAAVIDAASYNFVSRDPLGATIFTAPGKNWPAPARAIGSFALTYLAGWEVTATENKIPPSVQLMVERAVEFREGSGLAGFTISSLKINVADSYKTDALPREIAGIGRAYAYRPGLIAGRP